MRYYVEINGNSSLDIIGLAISELPSISKPLQRSNREEIDGRDGDVITKLGYSAYDKTLKIGLWGNYDINDVIAFFDTSGKITFSNEPDKYYYFEILNRADFINQLEAFRTASITIHCQPFKYKEEESPEFEREYVEKTGTSITWDETLEAPLPIVPKGNTSQTGTPTPSSPIPVNVVSGDNDIVVCGKNLFDKASGIITPGYYDASGNLNTSDATLSCSNIYIPCKPNTSYTISSDTNTLYRLCEYQSDKTYIKRTYNSSPTKSFTITTTANTYFIRMGGTLTSVLNTLQIEESSTASTYETYNGNTYNIDLPVENLFDKDNANVVDNLDIAQTQNKYATNTNFAVIYLKLPIGTYTISLNTDSDCNVSVASSDEIPANGIVHQSRLSRDGKVFTYTSQYQYLSICLRKTQISINDFKDILQIEQGSKANTYTPYGTTPIELNKIGTYHDYFYKQNGKWYLHKEVGKVVLDENASLTKSNSGTQYNVNRYYFIASGKLDSSRDLIKSDYFSINGDSSIYNSNISLMFGGASNETNRIFFQFDSSFTDMDTTTKVQTWLSTHNTIVYYVLETPTNTEITYTPLIEQLNTLEEAQSYEGTTNLTQVNNDLPFIITASVLCGSQIFLVHNSGNIVSKPTLTINGSGDIGISLNGNQIFQIALGDEEYITIDVANMEAYKDGVLKNRLVQGDYNNFLLEPGDNTISFTGDITSAEILNYSRWI